MCTRQGLTSKENEAGFYDPSPSYTIKPACAQAAPENEKSLYTFLFDAIIDFSSVVMTPIAICSFT